jgi:dihydrodipicolinate reductase
LGRALPGKAEKMRSCSDGTAAEVEEFVWEAEEENARVRQGRRKHKARRVASMSSIAGEVIGREALFFFKG